MIKVVVIGAGNVAYHLIKAFANSSTVKVIQQYKRSLNKEATDTSIPQTNNLALLTEADVYILCVPDDAIVPLSKKIEVKNGLLVHTSGSVDMYDLNPAHRRGVFYPLQTFSKNSNLDITKVPFCLEAEEETDLTLLEKLASSISSHTYTINSEQRKSLHLAAVFINNFVNHLYHIGHEICSENKVPFEVLKPLIVETAQKIMNISPFEAQTGPAKRNDVNTIEQQQQAITQLAHKEIYTLITHSIQHTYGKKL